ncbi:M23 family metallopeptidase [Arthrobacter celericrescens]|uniref:M23 family metallopeptidase n=1 Tax=Arthrobacter celericrescens TaxID=2320851 RepID=UPI000EA04174|nr:M23 family metallopeptidase [Arthrobacter celericrescens]
MTTQNTRGRRRASGPVAELRPRAVARADQPRESRPVTRRRRSPLQQVADFAAASGVGQKAGAALAATGLILTVAIPGSGGLNATSEAGSAAAQAMGSQPEIPVSAGAKVDFSRMAVSTKADPDAKLRQLLSAQSAGSVQAASSQGSLGAPLTSMVSVSPFGYRINPFTGGYGEFHRGRDFAAQCGTDVFAAASGTVTFAGWHPYGGGNRVVIDHGNGLETTYNHLSSFNVSVGQSVNRGDVVALSGTTGASTGCHLHFEVMVNGEVVEPQGWL